MDDTWGISGPVFLSGYLLLAASVWAATARARAVLADPRVARPVPDLGAHPHDVAFLNGGGELAVTSALTAMHLAGTIAPERGRIQAVGKLAPGYADLERAIHVTAASRVRRHSLPRQSSVHTALGRIESRLVAGGLLLTPQVRARMQGMGWWMVAVGALGLWRALAGISGGKPVAFVVMATLGAFAVAAWQFARSPRRSRLGNRTLAALRQQHHELSPTARPDWVAYGPAAAALGVGMFGASALWASDPAFASEIALQRASTGGDGGSGGFFGGGGSGGGGSGGDGGGGGGGCGGGCGG